MKKIKIGGAVALLLVAMTMMSCDVKRSGMSNAIPQRPGHIQFWNGGGLILELEDARLDIETVLVTRPYGKDVSYYLYRVEAKAGTKYTIMDSEALAVMWW